MSIGDTSTSTNNTRASAQSVQDRGKIIDPFLWITLRQGQKILKRLEDERDFRKFVVVHVDEYVMAWMLYPEDKDHPHLIWSLEWNDALESVRLQQNFEDGVLRLYTEMNIKHAENILREYAQHPNVMTTVYRWRESQ